MLGLIVLANASDDGAPSMAMADLVGVPVVARAIAGALPTDESVTAVLVVEAGREEAMKSAVVERFAFDEVDAVVASGPGLVAGVRAGLAALADDVDTVIVQHGSASLVPTALVDRIVASARASECAAPAVALRGHVVADEGDGLVPLDIRARLRAVQHPQAFKRTTLSAALEGAGGDGASMPVDAASLVAGAGGAVQLVSGDDDNRVIEDEADLGRAVEVFARRAADFAFVFPRDLLPEDPLRAAIDAVSSMDGAEASHDGAERA